VTPNRWIKPGLAGALVFSLALGGCVVVPADPYYAGGLVMVAPPAPRAEVIGVAPVPGYLWIGGYWNWTGHRHDWVAGHWEAPRPGHRWVPHQWARDGSGWRLHPGYWQRGG
jgi:hypothetical protein